MREESKGWYGDSKLILHAEGRYLTKENSKKVKKTVDKSFTMR